MTYLCWFFIRMYICRVYVYWNEHLGRLMIDLGRVDPCDKFIAFQVSAFFARQEAKVGKRISAWLMVICGGFVGFCILCKSGTLLKMLITVDCEAISRMVVVIYARQGGSSYLRARNSNKSIRWLRCNDMSNALRTPTSITAKITTAACTVMLSNLYVPESCLSTRYK